MGSALEEALKQGPDEQLAYIAEAIKAIGEEQEALRQTLENQPDYRKYRVIVENCESIIKEEEEKQKTKKEQYEQAIQTPESEEAWNRRNKKLADFLVRSNAIIRERRTTWMGATRLITPETHKIWAEVDGGFEAREREIRLELYARTQYPEVMEKLAGEVDELLGELIRNVPGLEMREMTVQEVDALAASGDKENGGDILEYWRDTLANLAYGGSRASSVIARESGDQQLKTPVSARFVFALNAQDEQGRQMTIPAETVDSLEQLGIVNISDENQGRSALTNAGQAVLRRLRELYDQKVPHHEHQHRHGPDCARHTLH